MFSKTAIFVLAALAFLVANATVTGAAFADDCALKQLASLDIKTLPDGDIAIPASVDGREGLFVIVMSSPHTLVSGDVLYDQRLVAFTLPGGATIEGTDTSANVPDFKIAGIDVQNATVLWLMQKPKEDGVIGYIGTDILGMFDVELDIRHAKLNLFSPDHCPGHVVYWTNSAAAAIPFEFDAVGAVSFDAELDGKPLKAALSTLPGHGTIRPDVARDVLGYEIPSSPAPMKDERGNPVVASPVPFKTLTMGGITISNPQIAVVGLINGPKCDGMPHMYHGMRLACRQDTGLHLGLAELSALRLYFAFHEKTLYVTAADASR